MPSQKMCINEERKEAKVRLRHCDPTSRSPPTYWGAELSVHSRGREPATWSDSWRPTFDEQTATDLPFVNKNLNRLFRSENSNTPFICCQLSTVLSLLTVSQLFCHYSLLCLLIVTSMCRIKIIMPGHGVMYAVTTAADLEVQIRPGHWTRPYYDLTVPVEYGVDFLQTSITKFGCFDLTTTAHLKELNIFIN